MKRHSFSWAAFSKAARDMTAWKYAASNYQGIKSSFAPARKVRLGSTGFRATRVFFRNSMHVGSP
jgi:hypothetical protein